MAESSHLIPNLYPDLESIIRRTGAASHPYPESLVRGTGAASDPDPESTIMGEASHPHPESNIRRTGVFSYSYPEDIIRGMGAMAISALFAAKVKSISLQIIVICFCFFVAC